MAKELSEFTLQELLEEIDRRFDEGRDSGNISYCDDCFYFRLRRGAAPRCAKGHKMSFRVPIDMNDVDKCNWGHYKRVCKDRMRLPPNRDEQIVT